MMSSPSQGPKSTFIVCSFCIVFCLLVVKETLYERVTLMTFTAHHYHVTKFADMGNQMLTSITGNYVIKSKMAFDKVVTVSKSREHNDVNGQALKKKQDPKTEHNRAKTKQAPKKKPMLMKVPRDTKVILWYVKPRFIQYSTKLFLLRSCPWKCVETTNRAYYHQSHAAIFVAQTMRLGPPKRFRSDQVFVLHNHESPHEGWRKRPSFRKVAWQHEINWTMSYRLDSDIVYPYGLITKRNLPSNKNYTDIIKRKTKVAAWMTSHCRTSGKREQYVREIRKYLSVDIWGQCGKKCPRSSESKCRKVITNDYKFYLSFENAICDDYVTEKFFRQFNEDLITVVRGGKTYSQIAPKGVYVDTANFKSPKHLARYLNQLNQNDTLYEALLRRKDEYKAEFEKYELRSGRHLLYTNYHYKMASMCKLCERLWNVNKYRKVYHDIKSWFDLKLCRTPTDYGRH
ncbi:hypothetical protein SNE40_000212 [Patella caerulea]|uniref:Fucosyltransferase n=1 Tax=Patella caerulea TaxID=87958 RepID=A0AAN8Q1Y3_PATCE